MRLIARCAWSPGAPDRPVRLIRDRRRRSGVACPWPPSTRRWAGDGPLAEGVGPVW